MADLLVDGRSSLIESLVQCCPTQTIGISTYVSLFLLRLLIRAPHPPTHTHTDKNRTLFPSRHFYETNLLSGLASHMYYAWFATHLLAAWSLHSQWYFCRQKLHRSPTFPNFCILSLIWKILTVLDSSSGDDFQKCIQY
jgi:hypothetical protein